MAYVIEVSNPDGCSKHRLIENRWEGKEVEILDSFNVPTEDVDQWIKRYSQYMKENKKRFSVRRRDLQ